MGVTINEETPMRKILSVAAAAGLLFGAPALCLAQGGAQDSAPGQKMQDKGSVRGQPGASGYAPGHQEPSTTGQPGASGYAPGQQDSTSGQGSRSGGTNPGTSKTR